MASSIYTTHNGISCQIRRAAVTVGSATTATVVTGTANIKILLLACAVYAGGNATAQWKSSTSGTFGGAITLTTNNPLIMPMTDGGWLECASGDHLQLTSAGNTLEGFCTYVEIPT